MGAAAGSATSGLIDGIANMFGSKDKGAAAAAEVDPSDPEAVRLAQEAAAKEAKAKGTKKWVIIGGIVTLILIIGGVVFYFWKKGKTAAA